MTELPPIGDPALFIVLMTVLMALGASSVMSGWAERRFPWLGVLITIVASCGFAWVGSQEGIALDTIPVAFVEILARLIR